MISSLLIWSYILVFAYIYGWTFLDILRKSFHLDEKANKVSAAIIILLGLCGITAIACFFSLFINLGWLAQSIFFMVGLFLAWRIWKRHAFPSWRNITVPGLLAALALLIFLTILENGTHSAVNPDTGIYHAQAIRWIETYPAVFGLGNLHSRFAYNSSWLVLNAFFSFSFLGLRSFHVLPGAFLLAAMLYFLEGPRQILAGRITLPNVFKLAVIPLVFYTIGSEIPSPGTDLPADVLMWVVFALSLDWLEAQATEPVQGMDVNAILAFIFAFLLITVKLSAVMILLLAAFIFIRQFQLNKKIALKLLILPAIILLPWLARNLILSGYWIYPFPLVAGLSPAWDWKIPLDYVVNEERVITAWARIPRADASFVLGLPLQSWMGEWFENLTMNRRLIVLAAIFSPLMFVAAYLMYLRKKSRSGDFILIYSAAYCGLAFWLFKAPDIRFGYGILISVLLLAAAPLITFFLDKLPSQKTITFSAITLLILFQGVVLARSFDSNTFTSRLVLPVNYVNPPSAPCSIHGYTLMCAEYYNSCGYDPFPCIPPGSVDTQVERRGPSLRDGFRHIPDS